MEKKHSLTPKEYFYSSMEENDDLKDFHQRFPVANDRILGIPSSDDIEKNTEALLDSFNENIRINGARFSLADICNYLNKHEQLKIHSIQDAVRDAFGQKVYGWYNSENKTIYIDQAIDEGRYKFILGCLIGHFKLHSTLTLRRKPYNDFMVTEDYLIHSNYKPIYERRLIQWQAKQFSLLLILPKTCVITQVIMEHLKLGYHKPGVIYGERDELGFRQMAMKLGSADRLNVGKNFIEYRLKEIYNLPYKVSRPENTMHISKALTAFFLSSNSTQNLAFF